MKEDDFERQWAEAQRRVAESFASLSASMERFSIALAAAAAVPSEEWPDVVLEDILDAEYIDED